MISSAIIIYDDFDASYCMQARCKLMGIGRVVKRLNQRADAGSLQVSRCRIARLRSVRLPRGMPRVNQQVESLRSSVISRCVSPAAFSTARVARNIALLSSER